MEDAVQMAVAFFSIVAIVKIISDNIVRKRLIDKGMVDEKVKFLYDGSPRAKALSNLKWGIVLIGIGVAAVLGRIGPEYFSREGALGLMFIFAGVGFLLYYFLLARLVGKEGKNVED